ncbi:MAG: AtpZ/AtpI family protein [Candidatus Margulisbacteria bacterium]|nr:AtpZ/AtpI family protein [Candidatus Margulisiibacteriota bacterium]MBU1617194.1 AtpZ/AtpI family protein [Candidatus Margulisiibacteriota bacterium]MBU1867408.1 AtpZ/AtpI family protein [Candidatus Margulisiibacteriota bacterium]
MKSPFLGKDVGLALNVGVELAVGVFLGALVGYKLDEMWHTSPWLLIIGLILGAIAGFWNAYKIAARLLK